MHINMSQLIIREITPGDSIDDLTALLHRGYRQLADSGLKYLATHQPPEVTAKRIQKGVCFVAEYDKKIISTLCYYHPNKFDAFKITGIADTAWLSQFTVEPSMQKQGVGLAMMNHAEQFARDHRVKQVGLDTAEQATHLIDWYKTLGYKFVQYVDWDITNYRSVALVKSLK